MPEKKRLHVIPRTFGASVVLLLVGVICTAEPIMRLNTEQVKTPILEVLCAVVGAALIITAVIGMVAPRLRGR
ncbi:hypothetical protein ACWEOE_40590 [Amycolatopsis sp. NPDC004368]